MQTPDSQQITRRFFEALDYLIENKAIRGVQTFTARYGIDRRNLYTLRGNPESQYFQTAWLSYLVNDYNISPMWLLTGKGGILRPKVGRKPASEKPDKK